MSANPNEYVAHYLDRLEEPDAENAFHFLIEAPAEAAPLLVEAYHVQSCSSKRAAIVEIIWQFRNAKTVPFLATVLRDDSDDIWRQALDGLVAIGGDTALEALRSEKTSLPVTGKKTRWIDEAIEKVQQELA